MTAAFRYLSGEQAMSGDRITYHGEPGYVEFVATQPTGEAEADWYFHEYPPGGIGIVAQGFGRVFLHLDHEHEDLEFVSRAPCDST
jgi:hypothetical protein